MNVQFDSDEADVLFFDDDRLNWYSYCTTRDAEITPYSPRTEPPQSWKDSLKRPLHVGRTSSRVINSLVQRGYMTDEDLTAENLPLDTGQLDRLIPFRVEKMPAQRIAAPFGRPVLPMLWYAQGAHRRLFLRENWQSQDGTIQWSSNARRLRSFAAQFFDTPFADPDPFCAKTLIAKGLFEDPVVATIDAGGIISPLQQITVWYQLCGVCALNGKDPKSLTGFGAPIAIWRQPDSVPRTQSLERVLILFSLRDEPTLRLMSRISETSLLERYHPTTCCVFDEIPRKVDWHDHYGSYFLDKLARRIESDKPDAIIIHAGFALPRYDWLWHVFNQIKTSHPMLKFATDAARAAGAFNFCGVIFDQTAELHRIVELIFGAGGFYDESRPLDS